MRHLALLLLFSCSIATAQLRWFPIEATDTAPRLAWQPDVLTVGTTDHTVVGDIRAFQGHFDRKYLTINQAIPGANGIIISMTRWTGYDSATHGIGYEWRTIWTNSPNSEWHSSPHRLFIPEENIGNEYQIFNIKDIPAPSPRTVEIRPFLFNLIGTFSSEEGTHAKTWTGRSLTFNIE